MGYCNCQQCNRSITPVNGLGLTMDQKHIVLATSSFALGGALVWWFMRRKQKTGIRAEET